MILTTGFIDHASISEYCGVVSTCIVSGLSIFKDILAAIKDITGGKVGAYQAEISKNVTEALDTLSEEAGNLGANCVMGIRIEFGVFSPGEKGTVAAIIVYGTAVKLRDSRSSLYSAPPRTEQSEVVKKTVPSGAGFDWKR
jgi:uncharacterized protein YbjQ (UPF0145 family)